MASLVDAVGSHRTLNGGAHFGMLKTNAVARRSNKSTVRSCKVTIAAHPSLDLPWHFVVFHGICKIFYRFHRKSSNLPWIP